MKINNMPQLDTVAKSNYGRERLESQEAAKGQKDGNAGCYGFDQKAV